MSEPIARATDCPTGTIRWLDAGHGAPIVLLHGIGSSARSWSAQLQGSLAAHHRLMAWNAPGYGGSTALPDEAPDVNEYAEALSGFLDALAIKRCHLVGHSLGALIAAGFAACEPQRLWSLTLASCAVGHARHDPAERTRLLESRLNDVRDLGPRGMAEKRGGRLVAATSPDAIRATVVDVMGEVDPRGYAQAAHMLSRGDMFADLKKIPLDLPVQVICGAEDVITPPDINARVAAARPGTPFTQVPDAGHALPLEQPERFDAVLLGFIGGRDGI